MRVQIAIDMIGKSETLWESPKSKADFKDKILRYCKEKQVKFIDVYHKGYFASFWPGQAREEMVKRAANVLFD